MGPRCPLYRSRWCLKRGAQPGLRDNASISATMCSTICATSTGTGMPPLSQRRAVIRLTSVWRARVQAPQPRMSQHSRRRSWVMPKVATKVPTISRLAGESYLHRKAQLPGWTTVADATAGSHCQLGAALYSIVASHCFRPVGPIVSPRSAPCEPPEATHRCSHDQGQGNVDCGKHPGAFLLWLARCPMLRVSNAVLPRPHRENEQNRSALHACLVGARRGVTRY